jgi:hypothetical protein
MGCIFLSWLFMGDYTKHDVMNSLYESGLGRPLFSFHDQPHQGTHGRWEFIWGDRGRGFEWCILRRNMEMVGLTAVRTSLCHLTIDGEGQDGRMMTQIIPINQTTQSFQIIAHSTSPYLSQPAVFLRFEWPTPQTMCRECVEAISSQPLSIPRDSLGGRDAHLDQQGCGMQFTNLLKLHFPYLTLPLAD